MGLIAVGFLAVEFILLFLFLILPVNGVEDYLSSEQAQAAVNAGVCPRKPWDRDRQVAKSLCPQNGQFQVSAAPQAETAFPNWQTDSAAIGTFWNVINVVVGRMSLKEWWPETGSNRRRRPFQGRAHGYVLTIMRLLSWCSTPKNLQEVPIAGVKCG
jgi:hypothetical protein